MDFDPQQAYWAVLFIRALISLGACVWAYFSKNLLGEFTLAEEQ
jgi:hypothetical protein